MSDPISSASAAGGVYAALSSPDTPCVAAVVLLDPIAAPADCAAALPASADIAVFVAPAEGLPAISGEPAFEVKAIAIGNVVFDLSDGYSLTIDEAASAIFVANALTGESILVWGAAEIQLDGADAARFWGTTSVELSNGTKITMETAADAALADLFRLDKLTVTQADRAMVITGIAETVLGDLEVVQSLDGHAIDDATRDGLLLVKDLTGEWTDEFGEAATQDVLNQTARGGDYGPGRKTLGMREVAGAMWNFVTTDQVDSLLLTMTRTAPEPEDRRPVAPHDMYRSLALYSAGG